MSGGTRARIAGTGAYLPERIMTNDELAERLDTSDAWIVERTGIRQRHIAAPHETAVMMATAAARAALADAGAAPGEVDCIIVATSTPDEAFPATALRVQAALGARGFGFDVAAACAGFVHALAIADGFVRGGQAHGALVIGAEVYSRILDWTDRGTAVLFGDGAGAVFLRAERDGDRGILATHLGSDGRLGDLLYVDGAVGQPGRTGHLKMNGREVFRHAVTLLADSVGQVLSIAGVATTAMDFLVPHQANRRIIDAVGRRLGLREVQVVITVDRHANTSAASVPLALDAARRDGRIRPGHLVVLEALGGGLCWGSAAVRM